MKGLMSALNDATHTSSEDKKTRKSKGWGLFGRRKANVATEEANILPPLVLKAGQTVLDSQSAVAENEVDDSYDEEIMTLAEFMSTQPSIENRERKSDNLRGHDLNEIVLGSYDGSCEESNEDTSTSRENIHLDEYLPSLIPAIRRNSKKIIGSSNTPPPHTVSRAVTSNLPSLSAKEGYGGLGRLGFGLLTANNSTAKYEGNGNSKSNSSNTSNSNHSPNSNGSSNCSMEKKSKCKIELVPSESHRPVGNIDETLESNNQEINIGFSTPQHYNDSRISRFHLDYSLKRAVLNAILAATKSDVTVNEQSRITNAYNNYFSTGTVDDDDDDDIINYEGSDDQIQNDEHDNINTKLDEHQFSNYGDHERNYKNDLDDGANNLNKKSLFDKNVESINHEKISGDGDHVEMQREMNFNFKMSPNPIYLPSEKINENDRKENENENDISYDRGNTFANKIDNDLNENNLMNRLQISIENVIENNVKTEIKSEINSDSFKEPRPPTPSARPSVAAMSPKRIKIKNESPRRTQSAENIDRDLKLESEKVIRRSSEPIPPPSGNKEQNRSNLSFRRTSLVNSKKVETLDTISKAEGSSSDNNDKQSGGSAIKSDEIDINIDNNHYQILSYHDDQASTGAVRKSEP